MNKTLDCRPSFQILRKKVGFWGKILQTVNSEIRQHVIVQLFPDQDLMD